MADAKTAYDFVWYFEAGNIKNFASANEGKGPLDSIGVHAGANAKELVIETTTATPYLPSLLLYFMPLQKAALQKYGPTYNSDPKTAVSSGPFIVTEWTPTRWVAVANKNLPDDLKPYINKVIALAFDNQIQAYQAGKVDTATPASPADLKIATEDPVLSKDASPDVGDFRTNYFFFDMSKAPYNNIKFRQALSHLLDRDSIGKGIAKPPSAKPAWSFLAPGFPGSNEEALKDIQKYDPALAKQLYDASGVKVTSLTLQVRDEGNQSFNVIRHSIAQVFADEIKKQLGIAVEVKFVEQKAFMDDLNAKPTKVDFGMISYGMDYLDQSNMLGVFIGGGRHNWNNATYDNLLRMAAPLTDKAKRDDLYRQAEKLLVEEAPAIWTHHQTQVNLWRPYLAGKSFAPGKVNTARGIAWPGFAAFSLIPQDLYVTKDAVTLRPTAPK
jgi:ABC-type transport system substrate-binding protein